MAHKEGDYVMNRWRRQRQRHRARARDEVPDRRSGSVSVLRRARIPRVQGDQQIKAFLLAHLPTTMR
jgi:hypothetical protein